MSAEPMGVLVARIHAGDMSCIPERPEPAEIVDLDAERAFRRPNDAAACRHAAGQAEKEAEGSRLPSGQADDLDANARRRALGQAEQLQLGGMP